MSSQSADFLGISLADEKHGDKLDKFLVSHEEHIAQAIVESVFRYSGNKQKYDIGSINFQTALEKIKFFFEQRNEISDAKSWHSLIKDTNEILWEQVELLEGFVNELFHQLSCTNILKWQDSLNQVVDNFEKILSIHLSKTQNFIDDLKLLFIQYSRDNEKSVQRWVKSWLGRQNEAIDEELISNIEYSETVLLLHTQQFREHYLQVEKIKNEVQRESERLKKFDMLASLGTSDSELFESTYRFLKIWEGTPAFQKNSHDALIRAFRQFSRDKILLTLQRYAAVLELALYDKSRTLKTSPKPLFEDLQGRSFMLDVVKGFKTEAETLHSTADKLKSFISQHNPERMNKGESSKYAEKLEEIVQAAEALNGYYSQLIKALEIGPHQDENERLEKIDFHISRKLHTIAQPLLSTNHFKSHVDKILTRLEQVDELGGYGRETVDYVRHVLGRLLRADWKEHLVTALPHFLRLYKLHQGIVGPSIDQAHERRWNKLNELLERLQIKLFQNEAIPSNEIEYDINDIKGYLQDFLATLQRSLKDESIGPRRIRKYIEEGIQQLLEYRYLFGRFFASLKSQPEGQYFRQEFLFVDQYFEAIESKIYEFRLEKGLVPAEENT